MSDVRQQVHKLSYLNGTEWAKHSHAPVFELSTSVKTPRLHAGVPLGDWLPFQRLVSTMEPPYMLLYVLHTPRGEGEPGRYQSPELSLSRFDSFVRQFGCFLSSDARFDIWAHSSSQSATVVWDRHNEIYAYGPLQQFASALRALGYVEGTVAAIGEHAHHYRAEFDPQARELLETFEWAYEPLQPQDEQFVVA